MYLSPAAGVLHIFNDKTRGLGLYYLALKIMLISNRLSLAASRSLNKSGEIYLYRPVQNFLDKVSFPDCLNQLSNKSKIRDEVRGLHEY